LHNGEELRKGSIMQGVFSHTENETGRLVTVFLEAPLEGRASLEGVLMSREAATVALQDEHGRLIEIPWAKILAIRSAE
jgi:ribosome maturation factor RimP